jgi:SAM-dependent methyltransferase
MRSAYDPHGAALLDCFCGDADATLVCYQDGERDDVPASFWLRESMDRLEALGLDLCRGPVLDVGAGAGLHSLELQRRGVDVTALDVSPECVTVMCERGVRKAVIGDLFEFQGGPFNTVICLCNGLDKVGRLTELPRFLDRMKQLLTPDGQLIADSFDLRAGAGEKRLAELVRRDLGGRYFGEMDLRFEYKGRSGEPFSVLHVDCQTLARFALAGGWHCEIVESVGGHYLARAKPMQLAGTGARALS